MRRFDGYDIELTQGDSLQFKVNLKGRELPSGSLALFTIKKKPNAEEAVLEKRVPIEDDGSAVFGISSEESNLTARIYYWDIRVLIPLGDGKFEVRTPMEYAAFTILEAIGDV